MSVEVRIKKEIDVDVYIWHVDCLCGERLEIHGAIADQEGDITIEVKPHKCSH